VVVRHYPVSINKVDLSHSFCYYITKCLSMSHSISLILPHWHRWVFLYQKLIPVAFSIAPILPRWHQLGSLESLIMKISYQDLGHIAFLRNSNSTPSAPMGWSWVTHNEISFPNAHLFLSQFSANPTPSAPTGWSWVTYSESFSTKNSSM
jgi:hypothetical protein